MSIRRIILLVMLISAIELHAQLYTGMSGLINTPSAEMFDAGEVQIGGYYMENHFLPGSNKSGYRFYCQGKPYNTVDFYASITPFNWIQIGYTFTLLKAKLEGHDKPGYNMKDRYISLKLNPIKEKGWIPSIAIGANDFLSSATKRHEHDEYTESSGYFCNYYLAVTKHFNIPKSIIGVNIAYRYSPNGYFKKWCGVVGGLTWSPTWFKDLRVIAEWTGHEVNLGADVLLWKHLFIQAALVRCKYFSGGLSYRVNLF